MFSFQSITSSSTISSSLTQIIKTNLVLVSMSRSPLTSADVIGFQHYFKPSLSVLIQVNCGVSTQYVNCSHTALLCEGGRVQVEPCSPSLLPHFYGSGLNHFLSFLGPSQDPSRLIMGMFRTWLHSLNSSLGLTSWMSELLPAIPHIGTSAVFPCSVLFP